MNLQEGKDEAFNAGFDDGFAGKSYSNPHRHGHVFFFSYEEGFMEGRAARQKGERGLHKTSQANG